MIAQPRGSAKSEGHYGHEDTDHYDLIEWITQQPWSDGKVGMVGISGYAGEQWRAAAQGHPALKPSFPTTPAAHMAVCSDSATSIPAASCTPSLICSTSSARSMSRVTGPRTSRRGGRTLAPRPCAIPDYKQYINLYNILTQKGQRTFVMYLMMTHPWESDGTVERAEETFKKIKIPFYTGSGAYAYTYKLHWLGAQHYFQNVDAPKKLLFTGPAHLERPFHQYHDEIIRWYDHWLKGHDTGIMDEPPVRYWLMGANEWRTGADWPLPETQWTKYYLSHWETLSTEPPRPASELGAAAREPDVFTQMPLTRTTKVERLRYMTDPLPHDVTVAGPIALTLSRGDRSGRHQLDHRAQGCWARRLGSYSARGRTGCAVFLART